MHAPTGGRWRGPTPGPGTRSRFAEYLGASDAFDKSVTGFSGRYADQNEKDYQEFLAAIRSRRLEAREGV
jgi:hypothetical protein